MFECRLKIDGLERKLSLKDGLNIKDLAEILSKLSKCLSNKSSNFILTKIEESSYTPTIATPDEETVAEFNEIHDKISAGNYSELPTTYQEYAKSLNEILFKNGLYIQAINSIDERNIILKNIEIEKEVIFSSITSLTGKIVSLVGANDDHPHITFKPLRGTSRTVYIKPSQERELKRFYKDATLHIRIKSKIDADSGQNKKTDLIDFTVLSSPDFLDTIEEVKVEFGDIFININDSAKLLKQLRSFE